MLSKESLISAGYKPFKQKGISQFTEQFFQKRFDDERGKKYFITIAEYDNRNHGYTAYGFPDFSYQPESQFTTNEKTVFDITMHSPGSVAQMEEFFESMWRNLSCEYYEEF